MPLEIQSEVMGNIPVGNATLQTGLEAVGSLPLLTPDAGSGHLLFPTTPARLCLRQILAASAGCHATCPSRAAHPIPTRPVFSASCCPADKMSVDARIEPSFRKQPPLGRTDDHE